MIISICGFAGAGKDTLAQILIDKYDFVKLSFAGIIKDIASIIFSWDRNMLEGCTVESRQWREQVDPYWSKRLNMPQLTPRYILQYFGTDLFRNHFHSEIWIACIERKLQIYKNVVITDCRFENEINSIKKHGGKLIHVSRGILPDFFHTKIIPSNIHASETSWINADIDYTIENNSTIDELKEKIDKLIKYI